MMRKGRSMLLRFLRQSHGNLMSRCTYSSKILHSNVYVSTCHNIFYNLALEDWIYNNVKFDQRVMLLLWRNKPCVVIGRHQNPWTECSISQANSEGVDVARRKSGGGTVYHDMGNINISFFTSRKKYNRKENLKLVAEALNKFDLNVEVNERDDIMNGRYKISGTAAKLGKNVAYHHCTLLLDVDLDLLHSILEPAFPGIDSKATESVKAPCQNLMDICPRLSYLDVVQTMSKRYLSKYSNEEANFQFVDPTNFKHFPSLHQSHQELTSWEWIFAKTPKFTVKRSFTFETTKLEVIIQVQKGVIDSIDIITSSQDNLLFSSAIDDISEALLGTRFWPADVVLSLQRVVVTKEDMDLKWLISCIGAMCNAQGAQGAKDLQL